MSEHAEIHVHLAKILGYNITINPIPTISSNGCKIKSITYNGATYVSTEMLSCPAVQQAWHTFRWRVRSAIAVILATVNQNQLFITIRDVSRAIGDEHVSELVRQARPKLISTSVGKYVLFKENKGGFLYKRIAKATADRKKGLR